MVVKLAVLNRPHVAALVDERLVSAGDVDDRQAAHPQRDARCLMRPRSSGPRWVIASVICTNTSGSMTCRGSPPSCTTPHIPHTASFRSTPGAQVSRRASVLTVGKRPLCLRVDACLGPPHVPSRLEDRTRLPSDPSGLVRASDWVCGSAVLCMFAEQRRAPESGRWDTSAPAPNTHSSWCCAHLRESVYSSDPAFQGPVADRRSPE